MQGKNARFLSPTEPQIHGPRNPLFAQTDSFIPAENAQEKHTQM